MFNDIKLFESKIANFFNAPYSIATDSCTHAIELALRYKNIKKTTCPKRTYISIPMTLTKCGIEWSWVEENWKLYYKFSDTNIFDAATFWQKDGYINHSIMCLSFQYKKHLPLVRGGMILLDNEVAYKKLKKMVYDGRDPDVPWRDQNIDTLGYHYYMPPETAQLGLEKLPNAIYTKPVEWDYTRYPDLSQMKIFT